MPARRRRFFCPFCHRYCSPEERQTHARFHEEEFTRAYCQCGEELGLDIAFGSSRHSLSCCYHTVHFKHPNGPITDARRYVTELVPAIRRVLQLPFLRRVRLRTQFTLYVTFYRRRFDIEEDEDEDIDEEVSETAQFRSNIASLNEFNVEQIANNFLTKVIPVIETFCNQNSGWVIKCIDALSIALICGRNDSSAGRGCPNMVTPPSLQKVYWCLNIRGIDGEVFPTPFVIVWHTGIVL